MHPMCACGNGQPSYLFRSSSHVLATRPRPITAARVIGIGRSGIGVVAGTVPEPQRIGHCWSQPRTPQLETLAKPRLDLESGAALSPSPSGRGLAPAPDLIRGEGLPDTFPRVTQRIQLRLAARMPWNARIVDAVLVGGAWKRVGRWKLLRVDCLTTTIPAAIAAAGRQPRGSQGQAKQNQEPPPLPGFRIMDRWWLNSPAGHELCP